jgi:hypothetical protein
LASENESSLKLWTTHVGVPSPDSQVPPLTRGNASYCGFQAYLGCTPIHAAARTAAEGRATTCHATDSTITIGIRGPDAADRITQLRHALAKLITKHGWTTRDQPR